MTLGTVLVIIGVFLLVLALWWLINGALIGALIVAVIGALFIGASSRTRL